jgi:hypothetical protein
VNLPPPPPFLASPWPLPARDLRSPAPGLWCCALVWRSARRRMQAHQIGRWPQPIVWALGPAAAPPADAGSPPPADGCSADAAAETKIVAGRRVAAAVAAGSCSRSRPGPLLLPRGSGGGCRGPRSPHSDTSKRGQAGVREPHDDTSARRGAGDGPHLPAASLRGLRPGPRAAPRSGRAAASQRRPRRPSWPPRYDASRDGTTVLRP